MPPSLNILFAILKAKFFLRFKLDGFHPQFSLKGCLFGDVVHHQITSNSFNSPQKARRFPTTRIQYDGLQLGYASCFATSSTDSFATSRAVWKFQVFFVTTRLYSENDTSFPENIMVPSYISSLDLISSCLTETPNKNIPMPSLLRGSFFWGIRPGPLSSGVRNHI